jgi:hypothetical protein
MDDRGLVVLGRVVAGQRAAQDGVLGFKFDDAQP